MWLRSLSRIACVIVPLWVMPAVAVSLAVSATPVAAQTPSDSVWVKTSSGTYHCPGSHSYGTGKHGQYMAEATAVSRGYKPAKGRSCAARAAARAAPSGAVRTPAHGDSVWVNTRSHDYRCPGATKYGTGKHGAYMTEQAALAAGNHPSKGRRCH